MQRSEKTHWSKIGTVDHCMFPGVMCEKVQCSTMNST